MLCQDRSSDETSWLRRLGRLSESLAIGGLAVGFFPRRGALPLMFLDIDGQGSTAEVVVGDSFLVEVRASEIPPGSDSNGLFDFDFRLTFNAAAFSADTASPAALRTGFVSSSNTPGEVGLTANRFGETSGPSGEDTPLATFQMTALASGGFPLSLSHFTGRGDHVLFDGTFLDVPGLEFFGNGSITAVLEPSTALPLIAAVIAIAWHRHPSRTRPA